MTDQTTIPRPQAVVGVDEDEIELVWFVNGCRFSGCLNADGELVWLQMCGQELLASSDHKPGCLAALFAAIRKEMAHAG